MSDRGVICRNGSDVLYAEAATSAWYLAIKRDLRRAALFLWITSLSATRSRTLTASRVAASAAATSPAAIAVSAFFTNVRASVRSGLFSSRRRSATRIRFFDDFELANPNNPPQIRTKSDPLPRQRALNVTKHSGSTQDAIENSRNCLTTKTLETATRARWTRGQTWPNQGPPVNERDWGRPRPRSSLAKSASIVAGSLCPEQSAWSRAGGRSCASVRHHRRIQRLCIGLPYSRSPLPRGHGRRFRFRVHTGVRRVTRQR